MNRVIDISSWQDAKTPQIDFVKVRDSGVIGVMVKFSQGVHYVNPKAREHAQAAHDAGLLVGAYHVGEPGTNLAADEAAFFLKQTEGITLNLATALDLENFGKLNFMDTKAWADDWLVAVKGRAANELIYLNRSQFDNLANAPWGFKLWAAQFTPDNGVIPFMTQEGTTTIEGINGPVDYSQLSSLRGLNLGAGSGAPRMPLIAALPSLQEGDIGPAVSALQTLLRSHSYNILVDGIFDSQTSASVRDVQTSESLAPDGICGPLTWSKLTPTRGLTVGSMLPEHAGVDPTQMVTNVDEHAAAEALARGYTIPPVTTPPAATGAPTA